MRFRCECCACHTKLEAQERCTLCGWPLTGYDLAQARENVRNYGVALSPSDRAFAPSRHPILGPAGEYAIDRVALRARAYREFTAFGEQKGECTELTGRLEHVLACVHHADELYSV